MMEETPKEKFDKGAAEALDCISIRLSGCSGVLHIPKKPETGQFKGRVE